MLNGGRARTPVCSRRWTARSDARARRHSGRHDRFYSLEHGRVAHVIKLYSLIRMKSRLRNPLHPHTGSVDCMCRRQFHVHRTRECRADCRSLPDRASTGNRSQPTTLRRVAFRAAVLIFADFLYRFIWPIIQRYTKLKPTVHSKTTLRRSCSFPSPRDNYAFLYTEPLGANVVFEAGQEHGCFPMDSEQQSEAWYAETRDQSIHIEEQPQGKAGQ